jgi:hypothetical protein
MVRIFIYLVFHLLSPFFFLYIDIIFFIFLYQRWIYRVDPSRINEFGFSQQMLETKDQPAIESNGEVQPAEPKPLEDKKNE